jgi:hypothetical protein
MNCKIHLGIGLKIQMTLGVNIDKKEDFRGYTGHKMAIFTVSATSDNTTVQAVGMTIGSLMMMGGAEMLVGDAVFAQGATVGFTSDFIASGGNIGEALKGGVFGGLGAQLSNAIGHHLGFSDGSIGQTFAHGVSQGTISHLRGGDFRSGFIGGVLSKTSGGVMEHFGLFQGDSTMDVMGGTAVSMVIGGITSDAAGGSFMDGALSAMAVHLWNDAFNDPRTKRFYGDSRDKAESMDSLSKYAGGASAVLANNKVASKIPYSKQVSGGLGVLSTLATINKHLLLKEAGTYKSAAALSDVLTSTTKVCPNSPIAEFLYDEGFSAAADAFGWTSQELIVK